MEKFEILLYSTPEGKATIEVFFEQETFWLSQKKMSELFNVDVRTINEHLQNIFNTNELDKNSVIRNFRITASDGKNYNTQFYNLDAIIAVGYRVNSLDYAENQAKRNVAMSMADWVQKLDAFLQFNDYNVLKNAGSISHEVAKKLAEDQYEKFRIVQDRLYESDFDELAKKLPAPNPKKKDK